MTDPKPSTLSPDDDIGEFVQEAPQEGEKPKTCNLDDGPCESCQ